MKKKIRKKWKWIKNNDNILYLMNDIKEKKTILYASLECWAFE